MYFFEEQDVFLHYPLGPYPAKIVSVQDNFAKLEFKNGGPGDEEWYPYPLLSPVDPEYTIKGSSDDRPYRRSGCQKTPSIKSSDYTESNTDKTQAFINKSIKKYSKRINPVQHDLEVVPNDYEEYRQKKSAQHEEDRFRVDVSELNCNDVSGASLDDYKISPLQIDPNLPLVEKFGIVWKTLNDPACKSKIAITPLSGLIDCEPLSSIKISILA